MRSLRFDEKIAQQKDALVFWCILFCLFLCVYHYALTPVKSSETFNLILLQIYYQLSKHLQYIFWPKEWDAAEEESKLRPSCVSIDVDYTHLYLGFSSLVNELALLMRRNRNFSSSCASGTRLCGQTPDLCAAPAKAFSSSAWLWFGVLGEDQRWKCLFLQQQQLVQQCDCDLPTHFSWSGISLH